MRDTTTIQQEQRIKFCINKIERAREGKRKKRNENEDFFLSSVILSE